MHGNMLYGEDDLLPLSGLKHIVFCERRCALMHVEQQWADNVLTVEGSHFHERVHDELPRREVRGDTVLLRGLALRSLRLGLVGRADLVEFHRCTAGEAGAQPGGRREGLRLQGLTGFWAPFPVEYKLGKPTPDRCDEVQLCAQALCLEEMLGVCVPEGSLFYGRVRRRHRVLMDDALRELTRTTAEALHRLIERAITPGALLQPKCQNCSLKELCLPEAAATGKSVERYLRRQVLEVLKEEDA
ncbi:MAG: CRISPR-associated protein Cas4 [Thermodesulfobacteriota bacterium]